MPTKAKKGKAEKIDVRSKADIPAFMDLFKKHPLVMVLIHADYCGHCQTYKKDIWDGLHTLQNRKAGLGSVHYDQVENLPFDAKINGYPSVLLIGKDMVPAKFEEHGEPTNAIGTEARNKEVMENIAITGNPTTESIPNMTVAPTTTQTEEAIVPVEEAIQLPENSDTSQEYEAVDYNKSKRATQNLLKKGSINSLKKSINRASSKINMPGIEDDVLNSQTKNLESMEFRNTGTKGESGYTADSNTPIPKGAVGGSLYDSLLSASYKLAPAIALTAAGIATRKRSKRSKKTRRTKRNMYR
jgi:hypothetical protein